MHKQVSEKQVAANQSNAQKSTGPKTPEGKARASLNSIKHGAFAKTDNVRREIMARRGEDPAEYDQLQQDLVDSCQPEDALEAIVVKTIGDKTWDKLRLRRALLDRQLGSLQLTQARRQRQQFAARRWPVGAHPGADRGLCGTTDSPDKFRQILEHLDRVQEWFDNDDCPDEYLDVMVRLYGNFPTVAGERIKLLFVLLFNPDQAVKEKARQELPRWIAKEKSDVHEDRELYQRELALRGNEGPLPEDQVAAKEAALERQIREQTRLLLQLKSKRSFWGPGSEAGEAAPSGGPNGGAGSAGPGPNAEEEAASADQGVESVHEPITKGNGTGSTQGNAAEKHSQNGQTDPSSGLESIT